MSSNHVDQKRQMEMNIHRLEDEIDEMQTTIDVNNDRLKKSTVDLRKLSDELAAEQIKCQQLTVGKDKYWSMFVCFISIRLILVILNVKDANYGNV
jgi:peptidoglycan hydrolase CwlO-like protein